jgi:L-ribulokinase
VFEPDGKSAATYDRLYPLYRKLYFGFGAQNSTAVEMGDVLPSLRKIAMEVRQSS